MPLGGPVVAHAASAPGGLRRPKSVGMLDFLAAVLLLARLLDREHAGLDAGLLALGAAVGGGEAVGRGLDADLALAGVDGGADGDGRDALQAG